MEAYLSWWDWAYLELAPNPEILVSFLEEKDDTALLEQAKYILDNYQDTISYGFVANVILDHEKSRNNPLFSLWAEMRKRALDILAKPPIPAPPKSPHLFLEDYLIAGNILFYTGFVFDIKTCLDLYFNKKYKLDDRLSIKMSYVIRKSDYHIAHLSKSVKQQYAYFLHQGLKNYPEDQYDIRKILRFSKKESFLPYLYKIQRGEIKNDKIGCFYDMLHSSNPDTVRFALKLLKDFDKNQNTGHPLYFFYPKEKPSSIDYLREVVEMHESIEDIFNGNTSLFYAKKDDLYYYDSRITSKRFYEKYRDNPQKIRNLVDLFGEIDMRSLNNYLGYFLLLVHFAREYPSVFKDFLFKKLEQKMEHIQASYEKQYTWLDAEGFAKLIQEQSYIK